MVWELPNKGKKKALSEVLKFKKDFKSVWIEAYWDVCAIIKEQDNLEQFKQKL